MSNDQRTNVVIPNGNYRQWAKNFLYHQEGNKKVLNTNALKLILSFCVFTLIIILLNSPSPRDIERRKSMQYPDPNSYQGSIAFNPAISSIDEMKKFEEQKQAARNSMNFTSTTFERLKIIKRENLGKFPPGSFAKAVLTTGGSNGPIKARLVTPIMESGIQYLDSGATLIGVGSSSEDRLLINFSKIVLSNGEQIKIKAMAYDFDEKVIGIPGSRVNRIVTKVAASAGLNFIGAASETLQEVNVEDGVAIKKNNFKNAALNGASKAAFDQAEEMMNDVNESTSVIEVPEGTNFWVFFNDE